MDDKPKVEYRVTPTEVMAAMAGIDFVRAIFSRKLPEPPIMQTVEPFDCTAEPGVVVINSIPGYRHYNPIGSVHGGYAAILLDSAMGLAVHSMLPRGTGYTTLEFKVSFIKGMKGRWNRLEMVGWAKRSEPTIVSCVRESWARREQRLCPPYTSWRATMPVVSADVEPLTLVFHDDGLVPNSPMPLLVYKAAVDVGNAHPEKTIEKLFGANGWGAMWRNGVYDYLHYHATVHEALGVARGHARVRFGGDHGKA